MKANRNSFKAPQKTLKSSWVEMVYNKPKNKGTLIKMSLSSRPKAIVKNRGEFVTNSHECHSNVY